MRSQKRALYLRYLSFSRLCNDFGSAIRPCYLISLFHPVIWMLLYFLSYNSTLLNPYNFKIPIVILGASISRINVCMIMSKMLTKSTVPYCLFLAGWYSNIYWLAVTIKLYTDELVLSRSLEEIAQTGHGFVNDMESVVTQVAAPTVINTLTGTHILTAGFLVQTLL